jgi:hypothetical protein
VREEVADICRALALGAALLRRLGQWTEAARLEGLFGLVEERLGPAQPAAAEGMSGS